MFSIRIFCFRFKCHCNSHEEARIGREPEQLGLNFWAFRFCLNHFHPHTNLYTQNKLESKQLPFGNSKSCYCTTRHCSFRITGGLCSRFRSLHIFGFELKMSLLSDSQALVSDDEKLNSFFFKFETVLLKFRFSIGKW